MRLLIPILLLAGVAAAYFALRSPAPSPAAPAEPTADAPQDAHAVRSPFELADGGPASSGRATAPSGAERTSIAPAVASGTATPEASAPPVPEPSLEGGVTTEPVGTIAPDSFEAELEAKYLNSSRAERQAALTELRRLLILEDTDRSKSTARDIPALKREMGWLEESLDR